MLSKRLNIIYSFINEGSSVVDVGCDHGYLLIELAKTKKGNLLLGVENKKGPFERLNKNLRLNKLTDKIEVSLSDGLTKVENRYDTLVIAGMGSDTIIKIVESNIEKIHNFETIIIDSHTNVDKIRTFFNKLGYKIENEKIIMDAKIPYQIIKFIKGEATYNDLEIKYGPIILIEKDDEFLNIYQNKLEYLKNKLSLSDNETFKSNLNKEIDEITSILGK